MSIEELMALVPIESANTVKDKGRKTRWERIKPRTGSRFGSVEDKPYLPPSYLDLPPGLTAMQIDQFLREQRYDELTKKLASGELEFGDPDIRPPSPPPTYDKNGSRTNTRDVRVRSAMLAEYYRLVEYLAKHVEGFAAPADFKPMKKMRRIEIPLEKYPEYNFMGLIIGPRGCNHKRLEAESGTQISVRGKGTQKEGKKTDHQTDEEASMPMHVHIAADTEEKLEKAVGLIEPLLDPFHPMHEDFKKRGLEQLALVNGLSMSKLDQRCAVCGATGHLAYECPDAQELQSFKKAQVRCALCGDMGHVTMDCKLARPGADGSMPSIPPPPPSADGRGTPPPHPGMAPATMTPQQHHYEKIKMDYEYQKMMNELSGGTNPDDADGAGKQQSSPVSNPPGVSPTCMNMASSPGTYYQRPCYPPPPPPQGDWLGGRDPRQENWRGVQPYGVGNRNRAGVGHPDRNAPGYIRSGMGWPDAPNPCMRPPMAGHMLSPMPAMPMGMNAWGPIPPPPAVAAQFHQQQFQQMSQAQLNGFMYPSSLFSSLGAGTMPMWSGHTGVMDTAPPLPPDTPPLPPDAPPMAPDG